MSDSPPPLEPRLLEALREEAPAPPEARARARARLALAIPSIGVSGGGGGHAASGGGAGGAPGGVSAALGSHAVTVLAFVVGGAAGAGLHAALTTPRVPRVVYVATPAGAAPAATPSSVAPTPSAAIVAAVTDGAPPQAAPTQASHVSQLTAERSILDEVRASLVQSDASHALERLRASRKEFPRAILGEERDALTVEALVGAQRYTEARAAAETFRERFPDSLFSGAVDGAIRSIP